MKLIKISINNDIITGYHHKMVPSSISIIKIWNPKSNNKSGRLRLGQSF